MSTDKSDLPQQASRPIEHRRPYQFLQERRGFGLVGILALLAVFFTGNIPVATLGSMPVAVPGGALIVLLWRWWSGTPWREIGFVRPKSWIASLTIGLATGIILKLLLKAVVMPLLGASPINHSYHFLAGNRVALPAAIWTMIIAAGFGEEVVFRGYFFERFTRLFGSSPAAKALVVLLTAALFGAAHYVGQGIPGVEQAVIVGLVLGTIYTIRPSLFILMCIHAAFDLTALAIIYWDRESQIAHLLFK
ncbi:MAG TPA: type II CAAX endopeptidase family protein [Candidatus Angelobacter sp.]|nr:type II CAAX endopeptidase family protein [Candidatus Angelobacter sp.]